MPATSAGMTCVHDRDACARVRCEAANSVAQMRAEENKDIPSLCVHRVHPVHRSRRLMLGLDAGNTSAFTLVATTPCVA
jgi:hypothetical protein